MLKLGADGCEASSSLYIVALWLSDFCYCCAKMPWHKQPNRERVHLVSQLEGTSHSGGDSLVARAWTTSCIASIDDKAGRLMPLPR